MSKRSFLVLLTALLVGLALPAVAQQKDTNLAGLIKEYQDACPVSTIGTVLVSQINLTLADGIQVCTTVLYVDGYHLTYRVTGNWMKPSSEISADKCFLTFSAVLAGKGPDDAHVFAVTCDGTLLSTIPKQMIESKISLVPFAGPIEPALVILLDHMRTGIGVVKH